MPDWPITYIVYLDGVLCAADLKDLSGNERRDLSGSQTETFKRNGMGGPWLDPKTAAIIMQGAYFLGSGREGE